MRRYLGEVERQLRRVFADAAASRGGGARAWGGGRLVACRAFKACTRSSDGALKVHNP